MSVRFKSKRAAVVRPSRVLTIMAYVSLAFAGIFALSGINAVALVMLFVLAGASSLSLARSRRWPYFQHGLVEADETGVRIDGKVLATRKDIKQGLALPVGDACVVRLERSRFKGPLDLAVYNEAAGRKLLMALGLDASQTTVEMRGGAGPLLLPKAKRVVLSVAIGLGVFGLTFVVGAWWWVPLFVLGNIVSNRPSKIRIGVDGVHLRWLWVSRFTPFSMVTSVSMHEEGAQRFVDLVLTDGTTTSIPVSKQDGEQDLAHQRILQAFQAYEARRGSADTEALARGSRTPMEWLTALRGLGAGAGAGLRTAHIALDRLWSIVEDPSAAPAARAGAAAALGSSASKQERARIRVAAETIAEPRLRIAVEKAADEAIAEAELAEALAEVEERRAERAG
ncbi:MAG: hypothetical protein HOV80_01445 [Polyangiaceae bacterium]|nr:hypothetical protein [Polyangiaceae bacterium]